MCVAIACDDNLLMDQQNQKSYICSFRNENKKPNDLNEFTFLPNEARDFSDAMVGSFDVLAKFRPCHRRIRFWRFSEMAQRSPLSASTWHIIRQRVSVCTLRCEHCCADAAPHVSEARHIFPHTLACRSQCCSQPQMVKNIYRHSPGFIRHRKTLRCALRCAVSIGWAGN